MTRRQLIAIWIDGGGDAGIAHVERALRAAGIACQVVAFTSESEAVSTGAGVSTEAEIEALDALSVALEIEADELREGRG